VTKKKMTDRVCATVGLQDIDPLNEKTLVEDWIYEGTIDVLARTRCIARCVHLTVAPGIDTYILAQSVLALVDVENGGKRRRRRDDSDPGFTLIRSDVLRFDPTPSEAGTVDVWAVLRPQKMAGDDDDLGQEQFGAIPLEFQDAIELYALWKAADYGHEQQTQRGERYRMLYEGQDGRGGRLAQIRSQVNKRGTSFPPMRRRQLLRGRRTPRSAWID
jgi:hypothetical protein